MILSSKKIYHILFITCFFLNSSCSKYAGNLLFNTDHEKTTLSPLPYYDGGAVNYGNSKPNSSIKILYLYTKDAIKEFVPTCRDNNEETCYDLEIVRNHLESKAVHDINLMNEILHNSGITHRVELADAFPEDPFKSYSILEKTQLQMATEYSLTVREDDDIYILDSPNSDNRSDNWTTHWWPHVGNKWMGISQDDGGEIYDLRVTSKADIIVLRSTRFDPKIITKNSIKQNTECFLGDLSSCECDGLLSCQCINIDLWGGEQNTTLINGRTPGRCVDREYSGGAVYDIAKGDQLNDSKYPFITMSYNHPNLPHEIGHLFGLEHDRHTPLRESPGKIPMGYKNIRIPNGARDRMSYPHNCPRIDCSWVEIFGNPSYLWSYKDTDGINKAIPMGDDQGFPACTFEEMGYYASKYFDHFVLDSLSFTVRLSQDKCNLPANTLVNVNKTCNGKFVPDDNQLATFHGCTFIDGSLEIGESITDLNGNSFDGELYAPHNIIKIISGDLIINLGDSNTNPVVLFPNLTKVFGDIVIRFKRYNGGRPAIRFPTLKSLRNFRSIRIEATNHPFGLPPASVDCNFRSLPNRENFMPLACRR